MKMALTAGITGALFGVGLVLSGMTQADKVVNFLDVSDAWDPSLAFVMVGAIAVHLVLFRLVLRRKSPLFGDSFGIPTRTDIDGRLVAGSALFGVGWALGGYCPGPGLVSMTSGASNAVAFVLALTVGMQLFHMWEVHRAGPAEARPTPMPQPSPFANTEKESA
jgi:hypothetical protein